ncbi:MAG: 1,6-anhydro-N-acetylmuramyl-L-alanine amidase AmpD [Halioglobus sp.]
MDFTLNNGWLDQARRAPSPNFGPRPAHSETDLLVIHNISLPPGQYEGCCIEQFFCNVLDWDEHPYFEQIRGLEVSAHLLVRRSGELLQFVGFGDRAWHAGRSCFQGREECNDFSIGVELEGADDEPYEEVQYRVLAAVTRVLLSEYPQMSADKIVGHSEIAPGRKTDPGPAFDWQRYRYLLDEAGESL